MPIVPKNIVLVGATGSGKTTVLQRTMALLPRLRFGGYFVRRLAGGPTPASRAATPPGHVTPAEDHLVLVEGKQRSLVRPPVARRVPEEELTVLDPTSLVQRALPGLAAAREEAEVVVADELGGLPDPAGRLEREIRATLDAPVVLLATAPSLSPGWLAELARRPDAVTVAVHAANRAGLEGEVADRVMAAIEAQREP